METFFNTLLNLANSQWAGLMVLTLTMISAPLILIDAYRRTKEVWDNRTQNSRIKAIYKELIKYRYIRKFYKNYDYIFFKIEHYKRTTITFGIIAVFAAIIIQNTNPEGLYISIHAYYSIFFIAFFYSAFAWQAMLRFYKASTNPYRAKLDCVRKCEEMLKESGVPASQIEHILSRIDRGTLFKKVRLGKFSIQKTIDHQRLAQLENKPN